MGKPREHVTGVLPVLRQHGDSLCVSGYRLLERVAHFLNINPLFFLACVKRERHLPAKEVAGNQFVTPGLQPEHQSTVGVKPSHQAILHVYRVIALNVPLGLVANLVWCSIGVSAQCFRV